MVGRARLTKATMRSPPERGDDHMGPDMATLTGGSRGNFAMEPDPATLKEKESVCTSVITRGVREWTAGDYFYDNA